MDFTGEKIYKCGNSLSKIYKCGEVVWSANTTPDYYLYLTVLRYILSYESETFEVEVFTNLPEFQTIIPVEWVYKIGQRDNTCIFTINENQSPQERNTTLTFTDTMGLGLSASCQVIQRGMSYEYLPLTFEVITDGVIGWMASQTSVQGSVISYSLNEGPWTEITSTTEGVSIQVTEGDIISFKGYNNHYATGLGYYNTFKKPRASADSAAKFNAYGNIMSLIDGDNFQNITAFTDNYPFTRLFKDTEIVSAENLIVPVAGPTENCLYYLFEGCASLTTPPELPATTLGKNCYRNMFQGCSSLVTAPELPARTLGYGSYFAMFSGCTSLTTAPELPATTLTDYCCRNMFTGCTNLNYIKCLATDISAPNCTTNWVSGVASSGTFVKAAGATWPTGADGIPEGWTVIEE